jgi:sugar/nucleoside kinase (ribokinase family)
VVEIYFDIPVVAGAVVVIVSFLLAHAPKLSALAAIATIARILIVFILNFPPFLSE